MQLADNPKHTFSFRSMEVRASQPLPNMLTTFAPDGSTTYRLGVSSAAVAAGGDGAQSPTEPVKRKRGRPRKCGPEGTVLLGLTAVSSPAPRPATLTQPATTGALSSASAAMTPKLAAVLEEGEAKKAKGRPAASGKKLQLNAFGSGGTGLTAHVIAIKAGEDVFSKIMSFSQHRPQAVCILSANGAISNVTLRQTATSGGNMTYKGRFEILSLSGLFLLSENGGQQSRTGVLSVSLAGPDGRVLGGGVAGLLTAASPVQVVVGSFNADGPTSYSATLLKFASGSIGASSRPPLQSLGTMSESCWGPGGPLHYSDGNQQGFSAMPWK